MTGKICDNPVPVINVRTCLENSDLIDQGRNLNPRRLNGFGMKINSNAQVSISGMASHRAHNEHQEKEGTLESRKDGKQN